MIVTVIGKKFGTFRDKSTGEIVSYGRLYCVAPFEDSEYADGPTCEGQQALEIKASSEILANVEVGVEARLFFTQKGRLEEVLPV